MPLEKIVISVTGQTDLDSTIKKLESIGAIDEKNAKQFQKNNKDNQNSIDKTSSSIGDLNSLLKKAGTALAAAFTIQKVIEFGKAIVETTAKFQKFEAVLTNTLGSRSAAQQAMQQIVKFASETPFSVEELTSSFVKLANQGFKPTEKEMKSLGDLAASTGKSFDQLTEAIIDAQTGEFERLKEFGIRAQKEGDKVTFTFKGVKTTVDNTSESIRGYVLSLGQAQGVTGAMAAISKTLGGQISNLGDSFDQLLLALGDRFGGIVSGTMEDISFLVNGFKDLIAVPLSEKLEEERIGFNALISEIMQANVGTEDRAKLIKELNTQYGEYLPSLVTEKTTNAELANILDLVNKQLIH